MRRTCGRVHLAWTEGERALGPGRLRSASMAGRRPRVLILVENLSVPRDRRVWQESLALTRAGYEVVVVCPQGTDADREPYELREGVEIHRYPAAPADGSMAGYAR